MKKTTIGVLATCLLLTGCKPPGTSDEGEGIDLPKKVARISPVQGPSGGEMMDQTSPVGVAAAVPPGGTESAFPGTTPPAKGN